MYGAKKQNDVKLTPTTGGGGVPPALNSSNLNKQTAIDRINSIRFSPTLSRLTKRTQKQSVIVVTKTNQQQKIQSYMNGGRARTNSIIVTPLKYNE